jgi:hypothetical protein
MATADSTVTEFKKHVQRYINKYECYGCTTSSGAERVEFVPRDALEQFWTAEAVKAILWSDQLGAATDTQHLIETYLIVFSILVWMGKPGRINMMRELNIDDQHLPVDDKFIQGTEQLDMKELLLEFSKNQWKFCPLILEDRPFKRQLHAYHIVPIVNKEPLDPTADDEDGDVQVYKAQWHKLCLGSLPVSGNMATSRRHSGSANTLHTSSLHSLSSRSTVCQVPTRTLTKCSATKSTCTSSLTSELSTTLSSIMARSFNKENSRSSSSLRVKATSLTTLRIRLIHLRVLNVSDSGSASFSSCTR